MDAGISRTPKWPFLLADLLLIGFAVFLVIWYGDTPDPAITAIATLLGVLGGVMGVAPFVMDHQQEQRAQSEADRAAIRDLTAKIAQTGRELDQSADAVRGAAGEASRAAKASEVLPARMQAAVTDLERRIANVNAENSERFAMVGEQLQTAVQQVLGGEQSLARVSPMVDALHGEIASLNMALARAEFDRRSEAPKPAEPAADLRADLAALATRLDALATGLQSLRVDFEAKASMPDATAAALAAFGRLQEEGVSKLSSRLEEISQRIEGLASTPAPAPVVQGAAVESLASIPAPTAEESSPLKVTESLVEERSPEPAAVVAAVEEPQAAPPSRKRKLPFSGMLAGSLLQAQTPAVERIIAAGRIPGSTPLETDPEKSSKPVEAVVEEVVTTAVPSPAPVEVVSASVAEVAVEADANTAVTEETRPASAPIALSESVAPTETIAAPAQEKPTSPPSRRAAPDPSLLKEPEVAAAAELLHDPGILGRLAQLTAGAPTKESGSLDLDLGDLPQKPKTPRFEPSEGSTVLVARAYIGIGNKLYVRGEGPGLSRDRGVPMVFLEIGKWGWTCPEPYASVRCVLYRNDEQPDANGEVELQGGESKEITPVFGAA